MKTITMTDSQYDFIRAEIDFYYECFKEKEKAEWADRMNAIIEMLFKGQEGE